MNDVTGDSERASAKLSGDFRRVSVRGLEVMSTVGVPEEERQQAQRLLIDLEVEPMTAFEDLDDDIEQAVDYFSMSQRVKAVAESGECKLIETLAVHVADAVLEDGQVAAAWVRIRKFILPDTEHVAVEMAKRRTPSNEDAAE